MGRISVWQMEQKRHSNWNDEQSTIWKSVLLLEERLASFGLLFLAACSNCIVNLAGYSRINKCFKACINNWNSKVSIKFYIYNSNSHLMY